ncbi:MAG: LTA synthase family protein [Methylovulum sp.]|uniref:LTA synthase family protein n=1 Tax=Methylovulum sp. TaxID=1916980 RepID=UPI00262EB57A|nr:LTA synthase family protein [Methylovulum sp.]MDD2723248.1 LTA synthase family protein [Methylovulum sp.]MDD5123431.1 LTA synthase family protein [Methylovulum sp.]
MMVSLVLPPLIASIILSFPLEQWLVPKPLPVWRRPTAAAFLHIGLWSVCFAILLLLLQRPWFAVVNLLAFQLLLLLVNQAKYDSLREPFIFQDFEYFTDAIKHPRLYLPFFGIARTIAATIGFVSAFVIGLVLETPLTDTLTTPVFILLSVLLAGIGLQLVRFSLKNCPAITYNPAEDLITLGQLAFFCCYWNKERITRQLEHGNSPFQSPITQPAQALPHIVVIQSESFFDPRSLSTNIKASVLEQYDATQRESCQFGRLQVPAWGANTVRTECGFLTALTPEQMGIHQFNPYRLLANHSIPNLAGHLKQAGYRTLCIHPYHSTFYLRNKVFPRMGFDGFIDLSSFDEAQKCGQFIGDLAIADKIQELLNAESEQPLFIFVITMENHGPLHLEQPNPDTLEQCYHSAPEQACDDLTVYLQHLQNADLMIKQLKDKLLANQREGLLCWFGDHVPIMENIYQRFGEPDGLTDYFVWKTSGKKAGNLADKQDLAIHELAALLLKLCN